MIQLKLQAITQELSNVFQKVNERQVNEVIKEILTAPQIFTAGVGRSGYIMKMFTMRMMHLGLKVHDIGSPTTPSAEEGDLLIVGTGSGETESLKSYVKRAKKLGLKIITITSFLDSTLGEAADLILQIPSPTPKSDKKSLIRSNQPMGNLFEQSLLICLDALIMEIMEFKSIDANYMFANHANLE